MFCVALAGSVNATVAYCRAIVLNAWKRRQVNGTKWHALRDRTPS